MITDKVHIPNPDVELNEALTEVLFLCEKFVDETNAITGNNVHIPLGPNVELDKSNYVAALNLFSLYEDNYQVVLHQEDELIITAHELKALLEYFYKINDCLLLEAVTGEKYPGIGRKPLCEIRDPQRLVMCEMLCVNHFVEFNGGEESIKIMGVSDNETYVMEVKDRHSFIDLMTKLRNRLCMHMGKRAENERVKESIRTSFKQKSDKAMEQKPEAEEVLVKGKAEEQKNEMSDKEKSEANNEVKEEAHVRVFLVKKFMDTVKTIPNQQARGVMVNLCRFFTFHSLYNRAGQFMEDGYLNGKQLKLVGKAMYDTMELLRPNAVALSDSWDFADQELRSVLGRYDGQVYPNMLEWVKHSNLNKTEVLDSFKKYLAPVMKAARAKL